VQVGRCLCVLVCQVHRCPDLRHDFHPAQNATIRHDDEAVDPGVADHSATRVLLVLGVGCNLPACLKLSSNVDVAAGMSQAIPIFLNFA
jgi:hypothetical protein